MIRSFRSKQTALLFAGHRSQRFQGIARIAQRKLEQLNAARKLSDLAVFPGNHVEALKGDRVGQHSIRINDQYRICFVWHEGDALGVEIVDYH